MLALLESFGQIEKGEVVGIDIEIRPHNRRALDEHPLSKRITLIEGSSIDHEIVERVRAIASKHKKIMVCLDSNHTHNHVLAELEAYGPMVSVGCYCMVGDTVIEDAPEGMTAHRPWGKGNSPKTAVHEFIQRLDSAPRLGMDQSPLKFKIDQMIEDKILLTGSPSGYLKRI
jgi:cephalosporin hydroxylase